jgi:hypothetical protein
MTQAALPSRADGSPPRLTVRIADATTMLGIGRSKLYELIAAGEVETIKLGTATLIIVDSIYALVLRRRDQKRV